MTFLVNPQHASCSCTDGPLRVEGPSYVPCTRCLVSSLLSSTGVRRARQLTQVLVAIAFGPAGIAVLRSMGIIGALHAYGEQATGRLWRTVHLHVHALPQAR